MLFFLAAAALQPFLAFAAPSVTDPLSILVSDIMKRDLSGHEEHPYFDVYQRWLKSPIGSQVRRATGDLLEEHPSLVSIECRAENDNCLLVSRAALPEPPAPVFSLALPATPSIAEPPSPDPPSIPETPSFPETPVSPHSWWGNAHNLVISTHLKTYEGNDEDVDPPLGHEHHLDANVKCGTLEYRSTGFTLNSSEFFRSTNGDTLVIWVKGTADPNIRVRINQNYSCGIFADKCCLHVCETQLWIGEKEEYFDRDSTCECVDSHDVSKQKCD